MYGCIYVGINVCNEAFSKHEVEAEIDEVEGGGGVLSRAKGALRKLEC